MAGVYNGLLQPDKAFALNRKAYAFGLKTNDKFLLAKVHECYANNLATTDSFELANHQYSIALKIAKEIGGLTIESDLYYNMGYCLSRQKKFVEALTFYQKAYNITLKTGDKASQCDALYKIGLMHYYLHNYSQARQLMLDLMKLAQREKLLVQQRNAFDILSCIEHETGNDKKVYDYLNGYIDKMSEIYTEEDQKQINFMNGKFQAQKREADIYRLEAEKQLQTEQMRKKNLFIVAIAILSFLITFSGVILLRYYRQKQKLIKQENEIQKHKIRELENEKILLATQSVLQGEESERQRLAMDLHDGLGGLLFGVKLTLANMKGNVIITNEGVNDFDRALVMLDTSITELRRVAHNMMPEALLKFGLKDTLSDICESLNTVHPMNVRFQFIGQFERLEQQLEINTYRIAQELINNAIKHSRASELIVQMMQEPGRLCLIVQDNGAGFDVKKATEQKGIGLNSVKSRVESMKGRIDIYSESGIGTEINVEFTI
jgi:signal transduction histidine kinase